MLLGQGSIEEALPHFARAISLNSENQQAHANLANALAHQGKTRQALHHYREALRIHPGLSHAANRLAWILATDPDPEIRAGSEAVGLAEQFCRPPDDSNPMFLDTLAAAYAETGRFPQALETAGRAAALAASTGQLELAAQIRQRMAAYREGPSGSLRPDPVEVLRHFLEARLAFKHGGTTRIRGNLNRLFCGERPGETCGLTHPRASGPRRHPHPMKHPVAFLLDADNTLLDNDRILADLMGHIEQTVGHQGKRRYWAIFEELREELGYADYLGALQGYRNRFPHEPRLMSIASFILNYPFADRLYPHSLEVVRRLKQWGAVVILSDGDMVFQPRKVEQSRVVGSRR